MFTIEHGSYSYLTEKQTTLDRYYVNIFPHHPPSRTRKNSCYAQPHFGADLLPQGCCGGRGFGLQKSGILWPQLCFASCNQMVMTLGEFSMVSILIDSLFSLICICVVCILNFISISICNIIQHWYQTQAEYVVFGCFIFVFSSEIICDWISIAGALLSSPLGISWRCGTIGDGLYMFIPSVCHVSFD